MSVAYKGTNYCGWQIQNNDITVQGVLNQACSRALHLPVKTVGSSRTDRGVHCRQQWVHFDIALLIRSTQYLKHKLNQQLPKDIAVLNIELVKPNLHARFHASSRTYHYSIHKQKNPFLWETSLYHYGALDFNSMQKAAAIIKQNTYFSSFAKIGTNVKHEYCTIYEAVLFETNQELVFRIQANRFLWGMVRALTAELMSVGKGEKSLSDFESLFLKERPKSQLRLAPAHGLTLMEVNLER